MTSGCNSVVTAEANTSNLATVLGVILSGILCSARHELYIHDNCHRLYWVTTTVIWRDNRCQELHVVNRP